MNTILDHIPAELKKATSGEWVGPCPKCGGTDRFHVWPDRANGGGFWCRSCGWQGDGIQFIRDLHGVGYREACKVLSVPPKDTGSRPLQRKPAWEPKAPSLPGERWTAKAREFVAYAARQMAGSVQGQEYAARRGLNPETITALHIGWNPSTIFQDRAEWEIPEKIDGKTGKPRPFCLPCGLVIPTLDANGHVVAVKIRRSNWKPEDKFGKFQFIPEGSNDPLILLPGQGKPCVVVESELDAILIAQEAGSLVTAVAMRSAKNRPDAHTHAMLAAAPTILIALDFDDTGKECAGWWLKTYRTAKVWVVPVGKDVGDLISQPGLVRAWIEAGLKPATPSLAVQKRDDGQPSEEEVARYAISHPHLVSCPKTKGGKYWWVNRTACMACETSCGR